MAFHEVVEKLSSLKIEHVFSDRIAGIYNDDCDISQSTVTYDLVSSPGTRKDLERAVVLDSLT